MDSFFFFQQDLENQQNSTLRSKKSNKKTTTHYTDTTTQTPQHRQCNMIKSNDNYTAVDIDKIYTEETDE
eukprot:4500690-Ditylum_brightwellii.AAC.1